MEPCSSRLNRDGYTLLPPLWIAKAAGILLIGVRVERPGRDLTLDLTAIPNMFELQRGGCLWIHSTILSDEKGQELFSNITWSMQSLPSS